MNKIGIDLGGTKIEGILLDEEGNVLERKRIPTNRERGYKPILESIANLIEELNKSGSSATIGICTPGSISPKTGRLRNSNTVCLIDQPIKEDLETILKQDVFIENDANCFAFAEAVIGSAKEYSSVFGVIMGTGVGGGIVINNKIFHGRMHIAGEWGHTALVPNGRECYCGLKGCVETEISGPSLERSWEERTGKKMPLKSISNLFNNPQNLGPEILEWKTRFLEYFGIALGNVITLIDPEAVVLGGGVSNIPFLYTEGFEAVKKHVFSEFMDTPILKNTLGDSAGVFGAAYLPEMNK